MDLFRVAVVQAGSVPFDRKRNTMKALDLTGQAIRSGARLIVFPEAFISGYPKGIDFGARVGMRSPEGRKWFRTYFESAITVPGPEVVPGAKLVEPSIISVMTLSRRRFKPADLIMRAFCVYEPKTLTGASCEACGGDSPAVWKWSEG